MRRTPGHIVATFCTTAMLVQPAAIHAQSLSVESSSYRSLESSRAMATPEIGGEMNPARPDSGTSIRRDWNWSETQGGLRTAAQIRPPRGPARPQRSHSRAYRDMQRVTAAFALGLVGAYAGWATTYSCNCGSPYTGMGIGAGVGAVAGVLLVR